MNKIWITLAWATAMLAAFWAFTYASPDAGATALSGAGSLEGSISDLPASPFNDPHIPSYNNGWCPGGGLGTEGRAGWCDGTPYDDGSFWHQNGYQGVWGFKVSTTCALRTDNPFVLDKAPAGGCDGEA